MPEADAATAATGTGTGRSRVQLETNGLTPLVPPLFLDLSDHRVLSYRHYRRYVHRNNNCNCTWKGEKGLRPD